MHTDKISQLVCAAHKGADDMNLCARFLSVNIRVNLWLTGFEISKRRP
jgi:hypothetical protein